MVDRGREIGLNDWERAFGAGWNTCQSLLGVVVTAGRALLAVEPERGRTYAVYAHRKDDIRATAPWEVVPQEVMVDVHFSRSAVGGGDPYDTLLTAESEANPKETIDGDTNTSPVLWDLYKLLAVPSPVRLFVAIAREKNADRLSERIEELASKYEHWFAVGDRLFSAVVPASGADDLRLRSTRFRGWVRGERGFVKLT